MRRALLVSTAVLALGPGIARAQAPGDVSASLSPNRAGQPSQLHVELSGSSPDFQGQAPQSLVLAIQRGFVLDPRAVAGRCTAAQADAVNCPEDSRLGRGEAVVNASGLIVPGGSQDFTATIGLFGSAPRQAGDLAGLVVEVSEPKTQLKRSVTGRVVPVASGAFGYELRFEGLSAVQSQAPPGVTVALRRLSLDAGARRTVVRTKVVKRRVRRRGGGTRVRRKRVRRKVTYSLVTNPATCAGSWQAQLRATFPDRQVVRDLSVPCSG